MTNEYRASYSNYDGKPYEPTYNHGPAFGAAQQSSLNQTIAPSKDREVQAGINSLGNAVDIAHTLMSSLEGRLQSILTPQAPPANAASSSPMPQTALGQQIAAQEESMVLLNERIRDLLQRLGV